MTHPDEDGIYSLPRNSKSRIRLKITYTTKPTINDYMSAINLIVSINGTVGGMGIVYNGESLTHSYTSADYPYNFDPRFEADYNGYFVITINFFEGMKIGDSSHTGTIFIDNESLTH